MNSTIKYHVKKEYEGLYVVLDDDGERMARVGRFNPGPMVSVSGGSLTSPDLALAVARAMSRLARELKKEGNITIRT